MSPSIPAPEMRKRLNRIMRNAIYHLVVESHRAAGGNPERLRLSLAGVIRGVGLTSLRSINPNGGDDFAMLWEVSLQVADDLLAAPSP